MHYIFIIYIPCTVLMKGETLLFLLWHCPFYIGVYGSWLTLGVSLKWPLEELQLLALQHWLWHSAPEIAACSKHYWFELNVRKLMSNVVCKVCLMSPSEWLPGQQLCMISKPVMAFLRINVWKFLLSVQAHIHIQHFGSLSNATARTWGFKAKSTP